MESASDYVRHHNKWRLLNSRRQSDLRRRQLDLGNELANTGTGSGSGDTSTRNSYVDYEWSSPSKQSEGYWVEVEDKGTVVLRNRDPHRAVIYDVPWIFRLF